MTTDTSFSMELSTEVAALMEEQSTRSGESESVTLDPREQSLTHHNTSTLEEPMDENFVLGTEEEEVIADSESREMRESEEEGEYDSGNGSRLAAMRQEFATSQLTVNASASAQGIVIDENERRIWRMFDTGGGSKMKSHRHTAEERIQELLLVSEDPMQRIQFQIQRRPQDQQIDYLWARFTDKTKCFLCFDMSNHTSIFEAVIEISFAQPSNLQWKDMTEEKVIIFKP